MSVTGRLPFQHLWRSRSLLAARHSAHRPHLPLLRCGGLAYAVRLCALRLALLVALEHWLQPRHPQGWVPKPSMLSKVPSTLLAAEKMFSLASSVCSLARTNDCVDLTYVIEQQPDLQLVQLTRTNLSQVWACSSAGQHDLHHCAGRPAATDIAECTARRQRRAITHYIPTEPNGQHHAGAVLDTEPDLRCGGNVFGE